LKDWGHNWNFEMLNMCDQGFNWKKSSEVWSLIEDHIEEILNKGLLCKKTLKFNGPIEEG